LQGGRAIKEFPDVVVVVATICIVAGPRFVGNIPPVVVFSPPALLLIDVC